jgi:hypothetical protein
VAAVDHLLVRGIEDLECRHDLASRHRLDLDLAARELVDALGEILEVVLQRKAGGPGGLELQVLRRALLRRLLRERRRCAASATPSANATILMRMSPPRFGSPRRSTSQHGVGDAIRHSSPVLVVQLRGRTIIILAHEACQAGDPAARRISQPRLAARAHRRRL